MLVARHYLVSGRVQGVGFRYFVHEAALFEHLAGWVKNRPDGRVEAVAEGPVAALARFEAQLRAGPPRSRVEEIAVTESPATGQLTGFRIERD